MSESGCSTSIGPQLKNKSSKTKARLNHDDESAKYFKIQYRVTRQVDY